MTSATLARRGRRGVDGPAPGDSLACPAGSLVGLPLRAAWKAAVATAEERLAGELLVLSLVGDEGSTRRFLVGVSGKDVVELFLVIARGLIADFIGDLK